MANPYQSPNPVESPLDAIVLDDECDMPDSSSAVHKTIVGVALTIGAVMGASPLVESDLSRYALLGMTCASLAYSASLSDKKEPSAT